MAEPIFTFDAEANAYISDSFTIEDEAIVEIELDSAAPVVTLKMEDDGGYANYGQTPEPQHEAYRIKMVCRGSEQVKLATPVSVKKCIVY